MGTKWGKTVFATICAAGEAWQHRGNYLWAAPVYEQTMIGYNLMEQMFTNVPGVSFSKGEKLVRFPIGSILRFRSADIPQNLSGKENRGCVLDEAAKMRPYAHTVAMTTMTKTRGWSISISTPRGREWFFQNYQLGCPGPNHNEQYASLRCPSIENPHLPEETRRELAWIAEDPEERAAKKMNIPAAMFRQEYLAEFIDDTDICFPGFRACLRHGLLRQHPAAEPWEQRYVAGLDLGKRMDFVCLAVFDRMNTSQVWQSRFNGLPWPDLEARILNELRHFPGCEVLVDTTGIGDVVYDHLTRTNQSAYDAGCRFFSWQYTSASKEQLIENLRIMIEGQTIKIEDSPETVDEYNSFVYSYNHRARTVKYEAAAGAHDDIVNAHALGAMLLNRRPLIAATKGGVYADRQ